MKYVVLLSGAECAPGRGLGEALREAGLSFVAVGAGNGSHKQEAARIREEWESEPLAVLFNLAAGSELLELHARVSRAAAAWPGVALVACRHEQDAGARRAPQRFDEATLKRLGFHAVAAETAQPPPLLREAEAPGTEDEQPADAPPALPPPVP